MNLLNVSFGIYAFMPLGWLFMAFVILLECFGITRMLTPRWKDKRIYIRTTLTNAISGIVGIVASMILNGGWYLVVWFPWVSSNEVDLSQGLDHLRPLIIYYFAAFLLTLIIEVNLNVLFFHKYYTVKKIVVATLLANTLGYAVGSLVLYSYSFR